MTFYNGFDIILYCGVGTRSEQAAQLLADSGFTGQIYNMVGGLNSWKTEGHPILSGGFLDIDVDEAWVLLNNTNNAIQKPIDVRTYEEWVENHIDTPPPENASHYPLTDLQDPEKLEEFMESYSGREIIFYSNSGDRSLTAAEILVNYEFEFRGTIYNMLGGLDAWKAAGYPTSAYEPEPTLCCIGELNWTKVKPGEEVTGEIEICNCGEDDSL
ncbi:unnamed protein product, partial [marine sediment metagenome]